MATKKSSKTLGQWFIATTRQRDIPRILLLDGGVSTHLQDQLGAIFVYREFWSSSLLLDQQNCGGHTKIQQGHEDWLVSGANVISTVTYQCHFAPSFWPKNRPTMNDGVMNQMWKDGIHLAQQAVKDYTEKNPTTTRPLFVLASSGCYGAAMAQGQEYTGDYGNVTHESLMEFHERKLQAAFAWQPDGIAIETIPSLDECHALVQLFENMHDSPTACYISLACRDKSHLNDGTPLRQALQVLLQIPADRLQAIGLNCCDSEHMPGLLEILVPELTKEKAKRGIVLYPNSGEVYDGEQQTWKEGTGCRESCRLSERLLNCIQLVDRLWNDRDSNTLPSILVGGCCRTTPDTIATLRTAVDNYLSM